jgi:hypothetical protein
MAQHKSSLAVTPQSKFRLFVDLLARQSAREWVTNSATLVSTATDTLTRPPDRHPFVCATGTTT